MSTDKMIKIAQSNDQAFVVKFFKTEDQFNVQVLHRGSPIRGRGTKTRAAADRAFKALCAEFSAK